MTRPTPLQTLALWAKTNTLRPARLSAWLARPRQAKSVASVMAQVDALIPALAPGVAAALDAARQAIAEQQIVAGLPHPAVLLRFLEGVWNTVSAPALQDALLIPLQALAEDSAEHASAVPTTKQGASLGVQGAIRAALGQNITGISEATRATLRGIIETARDSNLTNLQQARQIREAIGLTPDQASQLAALHAELLADGQETSRITRLLRQTSQTMKMDRALVIVETEAVNSLAVGQQALWEEQAAEEEIPVEKFRRHWVPAEDACVNLCAPVPSMNPNGVALDEPFDTPVGPVMGPALHPRCRCVLESEIVE
jgi:hypothetical protein